MKVRQMVMGMSAVALSGYDDLVFLLLIPMRCKEVHAQSSNIDVTFRNAHTYQLSFSETHDLTTIPYK